MPSNRFVEAVKVDPQTVDCTSRSAACSAVAAKPSVRSRMRQTLIERDDLPQDLKLAAVSELGQDYLKAGLLDRAEKPLNGLRSTAIDEEAKAQPA